MASGFREVGGFTGRATPVTRIPQPGEVYAKEQVVGTKWVTKVIFTPTGAVQVRVEEPIITDVKPPMEDIGLTALTPESQITQVVEQKVQEQEIQEQKVEAPTVRDIQAPDYNFLKTIFMYDSRFTDLNIDNLSLAIKLNVPVAKIPKSMSTQISLGAYSTGKFDSPCLFNMSYRR